MPTNIAQWIGAPDQEKTARATEAMMKMVKLDIAKLEAAYNGAS